MSNIQNPALDASPGIADDEPIPGFPRRAILPLLGGMAIFLGTFHYYAWLRLSSGLAAEDQGWRMALAGILLASWVLIPSAMLSRMIEGRRWTHVLAWPGFLLMGYFSSVLVLTVLRDLGLLLATLGGWDATAAARSTALAIPGLAFLASAAGFLVARRPASSPEVLVPIPHLPEALHGFRIIQLTDIHVGPTIRKEFLTRIVEQANALEPDLVAITGDVIDGTVRDLADHTAPLAALRARHGVALVIGNHELYSGALPWVAEFRRLGVQVLLNEHLVLEHEGHRITVAGVTDHTTGEFHPELACDPVKAVQGAPHDNAVRILLAHQPRSALKAEGLGFHLGLHGHTHGGQWWPWNHFVKLQQPVVRGLHRLGDMWTYTSVGTGYWGPPKRSFRKEISRIVLVPGSPSRG